MKTRIISGIVMGLIVAAVLTAGFLWSPYIITVAIALIAAAAVYELLHNAAGIKNKACWIGACVYSFLTVLALDEKIYDYVILPFWMKFYTPSYLSSMPYPPVSKGSLATVFTILFFMYAVFMILKNHKDFDLAKIVSLCALPIPYAFAFSCLSGVINAESGIYYLLLLLNFSSVCDMGAYFTGVTCGKHKLCPNISPKKTVEGAIGGVVSSIIVTVILCLCFKKAILLPIIFTVPLCILGMVGDLFASAIKRSVGLKDYGNLIPGHGGILDRVDSIIMIAPLLYMFITFGVI